jgi:hypothetical protein
VLVVVAGAEVREEGEGLPRSAGRAARSRRPPCSGTRTRPSPNQRMRLCRPAARTAGKAPPPPWIRRCTTSCLNRPLKKENASLQPGAALRCGLLLPRLTRVHGPTTSHWTRISPDQSFPLPYPICCLFFQPYLPARSPDGRLLRCGVQNQGAEADDCDQPGRA